MLKYFEVMNYKGFKDGISIDFSKHREYSYHQSFIKNNIVNKGLIYGKNGAGKSNFGLALFDIVSHITAKFKPNMNLSYQNGYNFNEKVDFKYVFAFEDCEVTYEYSKAAPNAILSEKLYFNNKIVIDYDFNHQEQITILIKEAETLQLKEKLRIEQSFVKYLYTNSSLSEEHYLTRMMKFVDKMLWFRSVKDNQFGGYKENPEYLADMIQSKDALKDFEQFLYNIDTNLKYKLTIEKDPYNKNIMMVDFENGYKLPFNSIASTGTLSLWLFYCWSLEFNDISFLFIDEFDAFYHYETAETILNKINSRDNFQSFVSTHNTSLMNNELIRPDCCYIISENKIIKSLPECTEKEIREAHNLERMYKNGGFPI